MRGKCLDEGLLQSYLDGELSPELMGDAAAHLASCDSCALALGEAQAETAFFAEAFAPDAAIGVPSERLRTRLDAAIAGMETRGAERPARRAWGFGPVDKAAAWLAGTFSFEPRLAGAFAGVAAVLLLAGLFALVYLRGDKAPQQQQQVAQGTPAVRENPPSVEQKGETPAQSAPTVAPAAVEENKRTNFVQVAAVKPSARKHAPAGREPKAAGEDVVAPSGEVAAQRSVPGEENYLRTIASLEKVVGLAGAESLRPKMRSEYERNVAVLDRAINETRKAALRNPQDADTAAFLFAAYQNKVELLTTVADQAQVATLGR